MNPALRWAVAVVGWLALLIIYVAWKDYEKHTGGGFIAGFLRGAIVFGGAYYLYMWAKTEVRQTKQETSELSDPPPYKNPPAITNKSSDIIVRKERASEARKPAGISVQEGAGMILVPNERQTSIDEDHIYEEIARELETCATEKGLWTRLFAECDGDENQTKVLYIKQRAEKLISAERVRLTEIAQAHAAEAERLESLRIIKDKENEFFSAVWEGNISSVDKLMREGIQPSHLRDKEGRSAYDLAAERKDQQMIQLFQTYKKKSALEKDPEKIVVKICPACRAMNDDSNLLCTRCSTVFQD